MAVKKPITATKLSIADFEAQALEAVGQKPGFTIVLDNEDEVHIPHPMICADERLAEIEKVQTNADLDTEEAVDEETGEKYTKILPTIKGEKADAYSVRLARAVLGDEGHKRLLAGGGKSAHVTLAWQALTVEAKSTPK